MKIHHVLFKDFIGNNVMETLCNRIVIASRVNDTLTGKWMTTCGNVIQCVEDPRDVTCQTCQFVWRRIK